MTITAFDIAKSVDTVPSLPAIFSKINEAVNDPRNSITEISNIISEDPGLSARLLRLVNSAFYNFPSRIETISRAVTIVGTQQLRDLALATSVLKLFKGVEKDLVNMEQFWKHSIACGVAARVLASYRRENNNERFFLSGVLHDIGRLILYIRKPELARAALIKANDTRTLLHKVEFEEAGFDHATVGGALLRFWNLPATLEEIVTFHHTPTKSKRYPVETALIHVADAIVHVLRLGSSGERYVPPIDPQAWESLGLSASILPPALEFIERQYEDAARMILQDH
ncbi:MAG: HDOD domain-containing protein [Terriglobia bacterium]